jgi:tetratricopeptide (TPR) repeat protein
MTGSVLGTPGYMAPEQLFGEAVDARSDQFSFCVSVYQALYGEKPFPTQHLDEYAEMLAQPVRPSPPGSHVPAWVRRILLKGLSPDAGDRYPSMGALLEALERDPTRSRRRAWLAVAALSACAALGGVYAQHRRSLQAQCSEGSTIIRRTWNAEVGGQVREGMVRSGAVAAQDAAVRVERRLDEYAAAWASEHRAIREATLLSGRQSATVMQQRLACLESSRQELESLTTVLSNGDAKVAQTALKAAYGLPWPASCSEEATRGISIAPRGASTRDRVARAERALSEARALALAGQNRQTIEVAQRALADVRAIPERRLEAQLELLVADCHSTMVDLPAAIEAGDRAFRAAEAAGAGEFALAAAARLAHAFGTRREVGDARRWLEIARSIQERLGASDAIELIVRQAELVVVARAEGHPEAVLPVQDRVIALNEKLYGPWSLSLSIALGNKGLLLAETGQPGAAAAAIRREIEIAERVTGEDDPNLFRLYSNLGVTLTTGGQFDEAGAALEHARALSSSLGLAAALPMTALASLYNRTAQYERTIDIVQRGLTLVDQAHDRASPWIPWLLVQRGRAQLRLEHAEQAASDCAAVLEQQERNGIAPDKLYEPDALTCVGEAQLVLGRRDLARAALERAVTLERRVDRGELAWSRFALARALWPSPSERVRARALAERARDDLRALRGWEREADVVRQFSSASGF